MKKKKKKYNNNETLKRIGALFIEEIEEVKKDLQEKRNLNISWPRLTDKITKHETWLRIKEDLKNFNWGER